MEKDVRIAFSFTDDLGTVNLEKTFADIEDEEIGTITWLLDEFKYFLNAMSFPECMTNNIVYLEKGEKVVDENGETVIERK